MSYPSSLFLERLIRFLMPFFTDIAPDIDTARAEILETLASYGARTRSELLNAAQIIAYSLSALETLSEAKTTEMSPSMRLRFRSCANGLNRPCQQNEKALARRLACDVPDTTQPADEPVNDLSDAEVQEAVQQAQAKIASYRDRLSGSRPVTGAQAMSAEQEQRNMHLCDAAMMAVLKDIGMPVELASPS